MPPPKKLQEGGVPADQSPTFTTVDDALIQRAKVEMAEKEAAGELYRFTSIGCLYRLRKLPSQPMLPERIILERRTSHLHEKEEWDVEWRQQ
jgi:hypothetical protein